MTKNRWTVEKKLGVVLGVLGVIILGLGVVIATIFFNQQEKFPDEETIEQELTSQETIEEISKYAIFGKSEGYDELVAYLKNIINNSSDQDNVTMARYDLAMVMKGGQEISKALDVLNVGLEDEGLSDLNRFRLLMGALNVYNDMDDVRGTVKVLEEVVKLPDDLIVPTTNWKLDKQHYIEELEAKRSEVLELDGQQATGEGYEE